MHGRLTPSSLTPRVSGEEGSNRLGRWQSRGSTEGGVKSGFPDCSDPVCLPTGVGSLRPPCSPLSPAQLCQPAWPAAQMRRRGLGKPGHAPGHAALIAGCRQETLGVPCSLQFSHMAAAAGSECNFLTELC